jgi:murein DD-endopeptidase MepM/ murein hydrolase activator NlpD
MNRRVWTIVCGGLLLSVVVIIATAHFALAELEVNPLYQRDDVISDLLGKIDEKKEKIDSLQQASEEYRKKLEQHQNEELTLQSQLGALDNLITKVELDIKTKQLQIDKSKLEIDSLSYEIDRENSEIENQKSRLVEYIKLINKSDRKSYLEILILNNSFFEFFSQVNFTEEIQADLKQSVDRLQLLKDSLEVKRAELERNEEELVKFKEELEDKQTKLKEDIRAKETLLVYTQSNEEKFRQLLLETKQVQNEIDSDILNIEDEIKRKIERLSRGDGTAENTLGIWPIPQKGVTTYFRDPEYPYRHLFEHTAVDLRASQGTPIKAPGDGYVSRTADNGYGYSYIIIIHANGISTVYGHVSAIYVSEGQFVTQGDIIGLTGATPGTRGAGNLTTGPHLHFEVRLNGIPVNPLDYLP